MKTDLQTNLENRFNEGFDLIQVILGPRQVGKTTAVLNILKKHKGAYLYFSAEEKTAYQTDWIDEVWQKAVGLALENKSICLLVIDEIQKIPNWSERIKSLWDHQKFNKYKINLILLGSSSVKIQLGLTESLTGRFELIRAFHWSLKETQIITKMNLQNYLISGGYPGSYAFLKNNKRFESYIQNSVTNTVIEKDLLTQARIKNPALFKQTFELLQNLPAIEISYTKLLGQLQDKGNTDLVKNYLNLYEGAFLFTQVYKYNTQDFKKKISTPKIICMAPVLLNNEQKKSTEFLGRCFESLVGSDLIKSDLNISYWRDGDCEVDFVTEIKSKIIGIEVKSGKRKSSKSVVQFKKAFPKASVIYINYENYASFANDPRQYILNFINN